MKIRVPALGVPVIITGGDHVGEAATVSDIKMIRQCRSGRDAFGVWVVVSMDAAAWDYYARYGGGDTKQLPCDQVEAVCPDDPHIEITIPD